jgi:peptide/nickel transport system permease protein
MLMFVIRRLIQAALTVLGVMLLTFVLFNLAAGDISAQYVSPQGGQSGRQQWRQLHGLDKPLSEQFLDHLKNSVTFQGRSYATGEKLTTIIARGAPYSLALTVPMLVIGWVLALVVSSLAAYYRDSWIDRAGVFLSVLGMCVPYLAYMILGQWLAFKISPSHAWGLHDRANIYLPIAIGVIAGLGASVRFYRTIILDQVNQDYVRTARAKGAPLSTVLFKHVLRNCMLPILTNLVMAVPMLIMGSLLLENFFGIPGLGDLLISSVSSRDVPIVTALTFLTAVIYVLGLLVTDLLYAVFDPRIRLR